MNVKHTIIGLPKSGKSTFLAALYHLVDSGEVETDLKIESYSGDQTYLNAMVRKWLSCEELTRTSQAGFADTNVQLKLKDMVSGGIIELSFPDLAGEEFESQIEYRTCRRSYVETCDEASGLLLFLTPDRPATDGMTVVEQNEALGIPPDPAQAGKAAKPTEWKYNMIPVQAQLVELLQFINAPPFQRKHRNVAVVISAWDLIKAQDCKPELWLVREMPFLSNFLFANPDLFTYQIYGVSAQGGDVKDDAKKAELCAMTQSHRIDCVGPKCRPNDITAPIRWLSDAQ